MWGPRSALLTILGDYVRHGEGEVGIGSLAKLLGNLGLSEQSVRSAVSRMCKARLLRGRRQRHKSYYSLTDKGYDLLNKGAQRIFHRHEEPWDNVWTLFIYSVPEDRRDLRHQLRIELGLAGFGPLTAAAWISPRNLTREADELAGRIGVKEYVQVFRATHQGFLDPKSIVSRCWDLKRIHDRYDAFIRTYRPKYVRHVELQDAGKALSSPSCFVDRFRLIEEYRRLPFFDPDLPEELLPRGWLRSEATSLFIDYHNLLADSANRYFHEVLKSY